MFEKLREINMRPEPFQYDTAADLWTHEHTAQQMLVLHLNGSVEAASRSPQFIDRSVAWMVSRFQMDEHTSVADFGCGPGLYAVRLAETGVDVTGIDFSENSIKYARKAAEARNLPIRYIVGNYLEFETPDRFDLIIMIMCDFCALSPSRRKTLLTKFHRLLKPGGSVHLDVYSLNSYHQKEETAYYEKNQGNNFWSPEDYYCFVNTFKYDREKVILDKYTIIEKSRKRVIYNWLQTYSETSLIREFEENGFTVDGLFGDVAGTPLTSDSLEIAVVAVKS